MFEMIFVRRQYAYGIISPFPRLLRLWREVTKDYMLWPQESQFVSGKHARHTIGDFNNSSLAKNPRKVLTDLHEWRNISIDGSPLKLRLADQYNLHTESCKQT